MENYEVLISTIILEKPPSEVKLVIARNIKENTCGLAKVLELINLELRARETCTAPEKTEGGKNSAHLIQNFHIQVHPYIQVHKSGRNIKCLFCRGNHWSDKCSVTSDFQAKKDFSKKEKRCFFCLKPDHLSRNCTKTKPCYYCKGTHNSDICNDRNKQGNQTPTNCASHVSSILLQTVDIILEN